MEKIVSLENKKVKKYLKLNSKKYREEYNQFIIEGEQLIQEAYNAGYLKEVLTTYELDIDIAQYEVTSDILKKISSLETTPKVIGLCDKVSEKVIKNKMIVLDNIQDPGNLGTIIRSAISFGIDMVVLSNDTVDLYNPKVIRATQGNLFKVSIIRANLEEFLLTLKEENIKIYGTNVSKGSNISDIKKENKYALIVGNEGQGMKEAINNLCDDFVYIPLKNNVESLNVGVAASILLYEFSKYE